MNLTRRIPIPKPVAIGILTLVAYAFLFGQQTASTYSARKLGRERPEVNQVPTAIQDSSISTAKGTKFSYFGYQFEVPWEDVDNTKTGVITKASRAVVKFQSGNALSVYIGAPHEFVDALLKMAKCSRADFDSSYGDGLAESDYKFDRIMLATTPSDLNPFMSRRLALNRSFLLTVKAISVPGSASSGIFEVHTPLFQGFQFGTPSDATGRINLDLYTKDSAIEMIFGQKKNGPTPIHQSDINRVIATLHPIPSLP